MAEPTSSPATPKTPSSRLKATESTRTSPSSGKSRRAHSKKQRSGAVALSPGDVQNVKTFHKFWEREGELAAYLGYNDTADLRRFAMTPYVLKKLNAIRKETAQVRHHAVLDALKDLGDELQSDKDPAEVYPEQDQVHCSYRVALHLAQMERAIRESAFSDSDAESARQEFEAATGLAAPPVEIQDVRFPHLGPFKNLGENWLEAANRCFNLLQYVSFSSNKSTWSGRFKSASWDQSRLTTIEHVPHWLRPPSDIHTSFPAPDQPIMTSAEVCKPTLTLPVTWKKNAKAHEAQQYRDFTENEEFDLPNSRQYVHLEPTATKAQFRDQIRAVFEMEKYSGQILNLSLVIKPESETDDEEPQEFNVNKTSWLEVQSALWSSPVLKSAFSLTVRRIEEGEDLWENESPPILAQRILTVKDGDIAVKEDGKKMNSEKEEAKPEEGYVETVLSSISKERKLLDAKHLFKGCDDEEQRLLRFFDGYDVRTPKGLLEWQRFVHSKMSTESPAIRRDVVSSKLGELTLSAEEKEAIETARAEGQQAAFSAGEASTDENQVDETYYGLHSLHTGTQSQVGPPLSPSALALDMEEFTDEEGKVKYRSRLPSLRKKTFFPHQVNGIASCLIAAFGRIPTRDEASKEVKDAANSAAFKSVAVGGKLICDQTGLGKTTLALAVHQYSLLVGTIRLEGSRVFQHHEMSIIIVPAAVIKQWADEIIDGFPDLQLIISYDDSGLSEARYARRLISATAMREFPNTKRWPNHFKYVLDTTDPKASSAVLLTSYETHVSRTLYPKRVQIQPKPYDPPQFDETTGEEVFEVEGYEIEVLCSRFAGRIRSAIIDEGHKLKDESTKRWISVSKAKADRHFILGATPMANTSLDIIAQIKLLWISAEQRLKKDQEAYDWVYERTRSSALWHDGMKLDLCDKRRLGFLHPPSIKWLLENGTKAEIARFFPLLDDLVCLRRSMASKIPIDFDSDQVYRLRESMEPYFFETLTCEFAPNEKADQQWLHRDASRRFIQKLRGNGKDSSKKAFSGAGGKKDAIVYPTAEMRELLLGTMSTKLRLFNAICKNLDTNTLVDTLQDQRDRGFDSFRFVQFLSLQLKLATPTTALGYLQFLTEGSPLLRSILYLVLHQDRFLQPRRNGKLLITEDVPLNAMFLEWALNLIGVETALFHAGLTQGERFDLQAEFEDPKKSLTVLIILYDVGGVGLNLWADCHTVIMATAAKNEGAEKQGAGRVIRAPQKHIVKVTKIFVLNSICAYRERRKRDKFLFELATRAFDPAMKKLLVRCLNEYQKVVARAQDDPANATLMARLKETAKVTKDIGDLIKQNVEPEKVTPDSSLIVSGKRTRKQIRPQDRFVNQHWDNDGKLLEGDEDEDQEGSTRKAKVVSKRGGKSTFPKSKGKGKGKAKATGKRKGKLKEDDDNEAGSASDYEPGNTDEDDSDNDEVVADDSEYEQSGDESDEEAEVIDSDAEKGGGEAARWKRFLRKEKMAAMRSEKQEDEGVRQLRLLLTEDRDVTYTEADLIAEGVLERALEIAYCMRTGMQLDKVDSIHIEYTHIHAKLSQSIDERVKIADSARARLLETLSSTKAPAVDTETDVGAVPVQPVVVEAEPVEETATRPVEETMTVAETEARPEAKVDEEGAPTAKMQDPAVAKYATRRVTDLKLLCKERRIDLRGVSRKDQFISRLVDYDKGKMEDPDAETEVPNKRRKLTSSMQPQGSEDITTKNQAHNSAEAGPSSRKSFSEEEEIPQKYKTLSNENLRKLCRDRNLDFGKRTTRADLVSALMMADAMEESTPNISIRERPRYERMSVADLDAVLRGYGVSESLDRPTAIEQLDNKILEELQDQPCEQWDTWYLFKEYCDCNLGEEEDEVYDKDSRDEYLLAVIEHRKAS